MHRPLEQIWADLNRAERITLPMSQVDRLRKEAAQANLHVLLAAAPQAQAA